jgi:hypothetical protein
MEVLSSRKQREKKDRIGESQPVREKFSSRREWNLTALGQPLIIRYQVDLTDGPFQPYLSGLPDSEWLAQLGKDSFRESHLKTC